MLVDDLEQGLDVVNAYAAEHLEIHTVDALERAGRVHKQDQRHNIKRQLLISKRPLKNSAGEVVTCVGVSLARKRVDERTPLPLRRSSIACLIVPGSLPLRVITDASLAPDGRHVAVRTYSQVFIFATDATSGLINHSIAPNVCDITSLGEAEGEGLTWADAKRPNWYSRRANRSTAATDRELRAPEFDGSRVTAIHVSSAATLSSWYVDDLADVMGRMHGGDEHGAQIGLPGAVRDLCREIVALSRVNLAPVVSRRMSAHRCRSIRRRSPA